MNMNMNIMSNELIIYSHANLCEKKKICFVLFGAITNVITQS